MILDKPATKEVYEMLKTEAGLQKLVKFFLEEGMTEEEVKFSIETLQKGFKMLGD